MTKRKNIDIERRSKRIWGQEEEEGAKRKKKKKRKARGQGK